MMELSQSEQALITLIRQLGFGTLQSVAVAHGQPTVVVVVEQRLDLRNEGETKAVLGGEQKILKKSDGFSDEKQSSIPADDNG